MLRENMTQSQLEEAEQLVGELELILREAQELLPTFDVATQIHGKLVEAATFQELAKKKRKGSTTEQTSCACFETGRLPQLYAPPIEVDLKGIQRWDCPNGWVASCRIDVKGGKRPAAADLPIQGFSGVWRFSVQPFKERGTSPSSLFEIAVFHGELGPEGEGVPFGPYLPDWVRESKGGVLIDFDLRKLKGTP